MNIILDNNVNEGRFTPEGLGIDDEMQIKELEEEKSEKEKPFKRAIKFSQSVDK